MAGDVVDNTPSGVATLPLLGLFFKAMVISSHSGANSKFEKASSVSQSVSPESSSTN